MGRHPCNAKDEVKRGAWSSEEDELLTHYVKLHGERKWRSLAQKAGLKRGGKSCRLRWLNYLRPGIKRGDFSEDEDELIIRLHRLLGNRWALIAGRLPGRTDNEVKNNWNSRLVKKLQGMTSDSGLSTTQVQAEEKNTLQDFPWKKLEPISGQAKEANSNVLIRENFCGLINDGQSSSPSMQIDQDDISVDVFNTNNFLISDSDGLKFDALQENDGDKASGQLENWDKIDPLLDFELRNIASLLDMENEFNELL